MVSGRTSVEYEVLYIACHIILIEKTLHDNRLYSGCVLVKILPPVNANISSSIHGNCLKGFFLVDLHFLKLDMFGSVTKH